MSAIKTSQSNWVKYKDIILNLDYITEFSVEYDRNTESYILNAFVAGGIAYRPRLLGLKLSTKAAYQVIEIQKGLKSKEEALALAELFLPERPRVITH